MDTDNVTLQCVIAFAFAFVFVFVLSSLRNCDDDYEDGVSGGMAMGQVSSMDGECQTRSTNDVPNVPVNLALSSN